MKTKIVITVIAKENDISKVNYSINNLKENNVLSSEIILAIKNDNTAELIKYAKDNNIKYYEYQNIEEVYYKLSKREEFDYISFVSAGDIYSPNFKANLLNAIASNESNLYICKITNNNEKYSLNKHLNKKVNIEETADKIWVHLNSVFISKSLLNDISESNSNLSYYADISLLTKLIITAGSFNTLKNITLNSSTPLEDSTEAPSYHYELAWYQEIFAFIAEIKNFSIKKYGCILDYVASIIMYLIKTVINSNVNAKNRHILIAEKLADFYNNLKEVLLDIEDEIILKTPGNKLVNYYLIKLKNNEENKINYRTFKSGGTYIVNNSNVLFNAQSTKIKIYNMDISNNELVITACYPFPFDENVLKIYATYNRKKIYATKNYMYSAYKAFGAKLYENYIFDLRIPLVKKDSKEFIAFYLESANNSVKLELNFNKPLSRLNSYKSSYWRSNGFNINYRLGSLMVLKDTKLRYLKRELKYILVLIRKSKVERDAAILRILYHLTKPFYKKEIWLFEDKIYKGGDNGEYLYDYARKVHDGIKKYYILNKDCADAERFKNEHKAYIVYGTLRHKLLFLNSSIVFETHNSSTKHHSFDDDSEKYFRDLYNNDNVCIQHGLSVQYIPHLVNRINDNLKMFFLASPIEKDNLMNKEYAYEGYEDILKVTGSPRYDGLKNNDKRQILITPTWRNYLASPVKDIASGRIYNKNFKNSDYFKIYNSLLNNEKLIKTAQECGYEIIYLLHPCTSPQIDDFDKNDNIKLLAATDDLNYEKILTESSLMVTDYSGVQFDFAYMYKPIVYFHPNELPPSYDEGAYIYETMSLGEIVKTNEELVNTLCEYMQNDCKIKDKYKKRIDKFFKYHDYNNCKRIYEEVKKLKNRRV